MILSPFPPRIISLPSRPMITLLPLPPTIRSSPIDPIIARQGCSDRHFARSSKMLVFISVGGVGVPEGGEEVIRAPISDGGEPVLEDDEPVLGGDNNEDFCAAAS